MPTETYTSGTDWTVPAGVETVTLTLEGEAGGTNDGGEHPGGDGGRVNGTLSVSPGETLYLRQTAGGISSRGYGGDGGDAADVRRGGTTLSDRIAVAAGGGGGSDDRSAGPSNGHPGGAGGADTGEGGSGTGGGTQSAGGSGTGDGEDGSFGIGGDGGVEDGAGGDGGGGGAGWYGGGGGESSFDSAGDSGAGGSNYDDGLTSVTANERGTSSRSHGQEPRVTIEYVPTPTNLSADVVRYRSIDLSWDSVSGADSYNIYVDGTQYDTASTSSHTIDGLDPDTGYSITITTVDGGTESAESDPVTPTTGGVAPDNVTAVANADTTVDLSWTDTNPDEDGYEIHRATASGVDTSGSPVATVGASVESYQDTDVPDGRTLYYRVVAVRSGERGVDSAEVSASTPLPAPTDLTANDIRDTGADLQWSANHENGETRIDLSEDDDGNWTTNTTVAYDVESATITGLLNGQLYGVRVVAQTEDAETVDQ